MSKKNWSAVSKWAVVVALLAGWAEATPTVSYGTLYDDGKMAVRSGSLLELPLTGGTGSAAYLATMPKGYANAEIFLTGYYVSLASGANPIRRIKVYVQPDSGQGGYDPSTGDFYWSVDAALQAYPVPGNADALLNIRFVLIAYNDTDVIVRRTSLSSFTKIGGGTCNSSSSGCEKTTTLSGIADSANNILFKHAFVGGFNLQLSLANRALGLTRVGVDMTGYTANNDDATGKTSIWFEGLNPNTSAAENVSATVDVVSLAAGSAYLFSNASYGVTGQSSIVNHSNSANSPTGSNAQGAFMGMRAYDLVTSSGPASMSLFYAGCENYGFSIPGGTTGQVSWQDNYGFLANYNASTDCRVGWLP